LYALICAPVAAETICPGPPTTRRCGQFGFDADCPSTLTTSNTQRTIDLLSDERFVTLNVNLHYFREKYNAILAGNDERRDVLASVRGSPYQRVARLFYEYLRAERDEVDFMLGRLSELEDHADGLKSK